MPARLNEGREAERLFVVQEFEEGGTKGSIAQSRRTTSAGKYGYRLHANCNEKTGGVNTAKN